VLVVQRSRRAPPRRPAGSTLRVCHSASRKSPNTTSPITFRPGSTWIVISDVHARGRTGTANLIRSHSSYWSEPRSSSNPRTSTHSGNSGEGPARIHDSGCAKPRRFRPRPTLPWLPIAHQVRYSEGRPSRLRATLASCLRRLQVWAPLGLGPGDRFGGFRGRSGSSKERMREAEKRADLQGKRFTKRVSQMR
jgi:hypothetical protein